VFPVRYELDLLYYLGKIRIMDLEKTESRNDCAGEGQQRFNRPTDRPTALPGSPRSRKILVSPLK
jgi:hypothetical protein